PVRLHDQQRPPLDQDRNGGRPFQGRSLRLWFDQHRPLRQQTPFALDSPEPLALQQPSAKTRTKSGPNPTLIPNASQGLGASACPKFRFLKYVDASNSS